MSDRGRVLIVDDDRSVVKMLNVRLQAEGYRTELAVDGATALKLAEEYRPDVILLDLAMPTVTGADVLNELKASPCGRDLPVVIITAYPHMIEVVKGNDSVKGCFVKPFDMSKLVATIKEIVSGGD